MAVRCVFSMDHTFSLAMRRCAKTWKYWANSGSGVFPAGQKRREALQSCQI